MSKSDPKPEANFKKKMLNCLNYTDLQLKTFFEIILCTIGKKKRVNTMYIRGQSAAAFKLIFIHETRAVPRDNHFVPVRILPGIHSS